MTAMGTLLATLISVFTTITSNVGEVLTLYTENVMLMLLLGLMVSGAIFSFARRLLLRR